MNIKHLIGKTLALLFASCVTLTSCSKNSSNNEEDLNVQFSVPSSVVIDQKNPVFTFKVLFDKAPRTDDVIIFTDASGADHKAPIVQVDGNYFTVDCKNENGRYNCDYLRWRSARRGLHGIRQSQL